MFVALAPPLHPGLCMDVKLHQASAGKAVISEAPNVEAAIAIGLNNFMVLTEIINEERRGW